MLFRSHDLAVLREPGWFNRWTRSYSRLAVPRVVGAATRIIAVSEFTRRELVELLAVPEGKVRVVPNAVEDVFTPDGPGEDGDYVLAVGTLEPRKNLERIAAAVDGELRVVGARGWGGVQPPANVTWVGEVSEVFSRHGAVIRAWAESETAANDDRGLGADVLARFTAIVAARITAAEPPDLDPEAAAIAIVAMIERTHLSVLAGRADLDRELVVRTLARLVHGALFPGD